MFTPSLVRDVYETEMEQGGSPVFDETDIFSVMKSPVATDDESPEDSLNVDRFRPESKWITICDAFTTTLLVYKKK